MIRTIDDNSVLVVLLAAVNPRLDIFGVAMTMFDGRTKRALSNEVVGEVRQLLGAKVFETVIPRTHQTRGGPEILANRSSIMTNTAPARHMSSWRRKFWNRLKAGGKLCGTGLKFSCEP